MSFGKPFKDRRSESLMVDDFDLFRGALSIMPLKLMPLLTTPLVVLGVIAVSPATALPDCSAWNSWNSPSFFEKAAADDVAHCLDAGADPNARNKNGWTPLHRAAEYSETSAVVKTLLDAGADLNARA